MDRLHGYAAWGAAAGGHVSVLQWMKDQSLLNDDNVYVWPAAVREGCFNVLQWLVDNGFTNTRRAMGTAVRDGRVDILQWARNHGVLMLTAETCSLAACCGRLEVLQWLRENECPWDFYTISAAQHNVHASIVQWARENGCPEPPAGAEL